MTTPDPERPAGPAPDDDTTSYDPAPWPASDAAPWPATDSIPSPAAATPSATAATPPVMPSSGSTDPAAVTPATAPPPLTPPVASAVGAVPPGAVPPGAVPPYGSTPTGAVPPSWTPEAPARRSNPPGLVAGVILVVIGGALLLGRFVELSLAGVTWPVWVVVPGLAMLVGSFFIPARGGVGLAIAGSIVTTVGLILWVQEAYDLYATWAYAWALVAPTAPGVGMLLYGLVHRDGELIGNGVRTTLVGIGLFLGFALFFEGVIGLSGAPIPNLEQVLPYAIIGLGILLVVLSFFGRRDPGARPQA